MFDYSEKRRKIRTEFPEKLEEASAEFNKARELFSIRRTPRELGIASIVENKEKFSYLIKQVPTEEAPQFEALMQRDIRQVRKQWIDMIALNYYRSRYLRRRPKSFFPPSHYKQLSEFYYALGTLCGIVSPSDKRSIIEIIQKTEARYQYKGAGERPLGMEILWTEKFSMTPEEPNPSFDAVACILKEKKKQAAEKGLPYTLGMIPGSFRPPHLGHTMLIQILRQYCDSLVVGVNSDSMMQSLSRIHPLKHLRTISEDVRRMLRSIPCLAQGNDYVIELRQNELDDRQMIQDIHNLGFGKDDFVFF